jgi:hypothetical protein
MQAKLNMAISHTPSNQQITSNSSQEISKSPEMMNKNKDLK